LNIFDLTRPLETGAALFPGDPPVQVRLARTYETDGYQVSEICLGSHSGTHIDAPKHFFPDGLTLDEFPVQRFVGPGVLVDCRLPKGSLPGTSINADLLRRRLHPHRIPKEGLVLLLTEGAILALDAAQLLVDAGAGLIGTDAPSLDLEPYPVHRLLLGSGLLLVENLAGLGRLEPGPLMCACFPLALAGLDGSPARVVAWQRATW
jgi:arylformamidase